MLVKCRQKIVAALLQFQGDHPNSLRFVRRTAAGFRGRFARTRIVWRRMEGAMVLSRMAGKRLCKNKQHSPGGGQFANGGLNPNTAYYYQISAINSVGHESARTSPISGTPQPSRLHAIRISVTI